MADTPSPLATTATTAELGTAAVASVFINYRRSDSAGYAGRLCEDLNARFGAGRVFMDVTDIEPGTDFRKEIERQVGACSVTLVIIGKTWLAERAENGEFRLSDPQDFVRLEIATALKRDIPVIPILVDGATMPAARDLPTEMQALAWRSAVELRHARWDADLQVLVGALRKIFHEHAPQETDSGAQPMGARLAVAPPSAKPTHRKIALAAAGCVVLAALVGASMLHSVDGGRDLAAQAPAPVSRGHAAQSHPRSSAQPSHAADAQPGETPSHAADALPVGGAPERKSGQIIVSAIGLADPTDPRYRDDRLRPVEDAAIDARRQAVEKALGLLIDRESLSQNYAIVHDRLLAKSDDFIDTVVQQNEPRNGRDGLVSVATRAVVNVQALQRELDTMSRADRIQWIRVSGDPRISLQLSVRDADQPVSAWRRSAVAENIVKGRIKAFGFRTWSEGADAGDGGADFSVQGEARVRRLSTRLEASGLVITKFTLSSWTVKCVDRATGEEIYFNTSLPNALGSFRSEEEALRAIGEKVADEFSREFFLQHVGVRGRKVVVAIDGMPSAMSRALLARELLGLPAVIDASARHVADTQVYELELAGSGTSGDLVTAALLKPINAKLGYACLTLGEAGPTRVAVSFDSACNTDAVLASLETNPPAGLYGAPSGRRLALIKNPDTLRKLMI